MIATFIDGMKVPQRLQKQWLIRLEREIAAGNPVPTPVEYRRLLTAFAAEVGWPIEVSRARRDRERASQGLGPWES